MKEICKQGTQKTKNHFSQLSYDICHDIKKNNNCLLLCYDVANWGLLFLKLLSLVFHKEKHLPFPRKTILIIWCFVLEENYSFLVSYLLIL